VLGFGVRHLGFLGLLTLCAAVGGGEQDGPRYARASTPAGEAPAAAASALPSHTSGEFVALTYNVAGLPALLSRSRPDLHMPQIGKLLNRYDLVLLQESWQTPAPNPYWPLRLYHEILVDASTHRYKTPPEPLPLGRDPRRTSAFVSDGLHAFSRFALAAPVRTPWPSCVDTFNDCRALKGFSVSRMHLAQGASVDVYNLHMEAGWTTADHEARDRAIVELARFIREYSEDRALIVGGDFNLRMAREPGARQFRRLLRLTGLSDACTALRCAQPAKVDRFLFRSGARTQITAQTWESQAEVFVGADGSRLSDHDPIAVRFAWSVPEPSGGTTAPPETPREPLPR
jgi:endonuclease/exonuclease/phosphatase family metal-dependent hydrolase